MARGDHRTPDYLCPFCVIAQGVDDSHIASQFSDVFYRTDHVIGLVASHWWPRNPGHALVIPVQHFENIYDLPADLTADIARVAQEVARAMKHMYSCDGITLRQNNERAGGQDVWHYHLHVVPRYQHDLFKFLWKRPVPPARRRPFALKLRHYFTHGYDTP